MEANGAISETTPPDAPGLERSCTADTPDWLRWSGAAPGITLLEAWFQGRAYRRHRHDTYAIGVTEAGIQGFAYRGAAHISTPGEVVVLHPDELHDGYAAAEMGFGYRLIYIEPALIFAATRELVGNRATLPFVRQPVLPDAAVADAVRRAFDSGLDPLATDDLVLRVALGLIKADPGLRAAPARTLDVPALERAREWLDAERNRVVRSEELEVVSGLSRYDLARQFRAAYGTSPYRYSLLRRLDAARERLASPQPLADIALETGFADQAHFTRMFTAAYGFSPGRYRTLERTGQVGTAVAAGTR
jgi:AraC-like DNA-binding protein